MEASVVDFRNIRDRLKASIAQTFEFEDEPEKCFSPGSSVHEIIRNREQDVARLLSHGLDACRVRWEQEELAEIVRVVTGRQSEEYACTKIMAILICISVDRDSDAWMNFTKLCRDAARACVRGRSLSGLAIHEFRDSELPFAHDRIKRYLSNSYDSNFYDWQYKFCAIVIRTDIEQAFVTQAKKHQHLPYLSEREIGRGSFGTVYCTEVAKGHWLTIENSNTADGSLNTRSRTLARKDLFFGEGLMRTQGRAAAHHEWNIAKHLREQSFKHENVVQTLAMLRFEDHISIFVHLAKCDLNAVLRGKKTVRRKQTPSGNTGTDPPSAITGIRSEYTEEPWPEPKLYEEKIALLRKMLYVAEALWHLHKLRDPIDQSNMACIHQDLKPGNILVFGHQEKYTEIQFKIADFSISSLKKKERHVNVNEFFKRRADKTTESSSNSDALNLPTPFKGGDANECLAPEAWGEDSFVTTSADVWSFACVLCIFIAWLFDGPEGLYDFDRARLGKHRSDHFFLRRPLGDAEVTPDELKRGENVFVLKEEVGHWFDALALRLEKNGNAREAEMSRNLWTCVRDNMLQAHYNKREHMGDALRYLRNVVEGRAPPVKESKRKLPTPPIPSQHQNSHPRLPLPTVPGQPSSVQLPQRTDQTSKSTYWQLKRKPSRTQELQSVIASWELKIPFIALNGMSSSTGHCLVFNRKEKFAFARLENWNGQNSPYSPVIHHSNNLRIGEKYCLGSDHICGVDSNGGSAIIFSPYSEFAVRSDREAYSTSQFHLSLPSDIGSWQIGLVALSSAPVHEAHVACAAQTMDTSGRKTIQVLFTALAKFSSTNEPRQFRHRTTSSSTSFVPPNWSRLRCKSDGAPKDLKDMSSLSFSLNNKYLILSTRDAIFVWNLAEQGDARCMPVKDHFMNDQMDNAITSTICFHKTNSVLGISNKESIFAWHYENNAIGPESYATKMRGIEKVCLSADDKRIYVVAKSDGRFAICSSDFRPDPNFSSQTQDLRFRVAARTKKLRSDTRLTCAILLPQLAESQPLILLANVMGEVEIHRMIA